MLTDGHIKEMLSEAYVRSIAAAARVSYAASPTDHDYGIDGQFAKIRRVLDGAGDRVHYQEGLYLKFQLKATTRWRELEDGRIAYDAKKKAYNKVVRINEDCLSEPQVGRVPCLLLLLCLPKSSDRADWADFGNDKLTLMERVLWTFLTRDTIDTSSGVVHFDEENYFSPEKLTELFAKLSAGELIDDHF